MRTLLKVSLDAVPGNKVIIDGTLPKIIQATTEKIKPEASYFYSENGCRTAIMIFDLKDSSEIPGITEPLFQSVEARITVTPVMNAEDLQKGLAAWQESVSH